MKPSEKFKKLDGFWKYPSGNEFCAFAEGAMKFSLPELSKKEYMSILAAAESQELSFSRMPSQNMLISFLHYGEAGFLSVHVDADSDSAEIMFAGSIAGIDFYAITQKMHLNKGFGINQIEISGTLHRSEVYAKKEAEMGILSVGFLRIFQFLLTFRESKIVKITHKLKTKGTTSGFYSSSSQDDSYHVVRIGDMSVQEFVKEVSDPISSHGGVRSHFRRGHIRRLENGRNTWVRHALVHGSKEGFVDKEYQVCA